MGKQKIKQLKLKTMQELQKIADNISIGYDSLQKKHINTFIQSLAMGLLEVAEIDENSTLADIIIGLEEELPRLTDQILQIDLSLDSSIEVRYDLLFNWKYETGETEQGIPNHYELLNSDLEINKITFYYGDGSEFDLSKNDTIRDFLFEKMEELI